MLDSGWMRQPTRKVREEGSTVLLADGVLLDHVDALEEDGLELGDDLASLLGALHAEAGAVELDLVEDHLHLADHPDF